MQGFLWTEEEHRTFLAGIAKQGDWIGISKNFVTTRIPTQVANHAQKYFLRQIVSTLKLKIEPHGIFAVFCSIII
ncbi:hypothetical protein AQUCO_09700006v1 [Aquilegia coerulea]|uniref:HTH myb-type domain-containing protein n=1 Tax=Aquilegia coerulea TaxID=218851 RepID=A0A2G5C4B7_AQUCA|nr:hypothetical protein AQUCO_09700006v1 [Aquilegia coerulea]